ncbi:MAG: DUF1841 family protein [Steroidobacteraceae bacterium]
MPLYQGLQRTELRRAYLDAWRKMSAHQPLEPLEAQIAAVIAEHPEYLPWLERGEDALGAEFTPEGGRENPFLHMSMHLAIRDQVGTDRPRGIARVHRVLSDRLGDAHQAEHEMMQSLGETLWEAARNGMPPDEKAYLERLERLSRSTRRAS